jgi:RNA polymerase sigma-70 factor (ECF subfamily)
MKQLRDIQDLILVRSVQAGRRNAFDAIVARYERRIYNLAVRMCPTATDAEDATQETFVAVYRGLKDFRGGSSLDTWIHRVAVNACLMRRRKGAFATDHDDVDESAVMDAASENDPLGKALHSELSGLLHQAVQRLPETQQTVVLLHGMQGFTYGEIASIVDCPVGTVKSRLSAAFSTLRRSLSEYVQPEPSSSNAAAAATEASL